MLEHRFQDSNDLAISSYRNSVLLMMQAYQRSILVLLVLIEACDILAV
jgi:hypothetical protein